MTAKKWAYHITGTQHLVREQSTTAGAGIAVTGACGHKFHAAKILEGDEHRDDLHLCLGCKAVLENWKWVSTT